MKRRAFLVARSVAIALSVFIVITGSPGVVRRSIWPAAAAGSVSPVTINSCGPLINKNQTQNVLGLQIPVSTSEGIAIEFVNESKKTATLVNFAVDSAGENFVIRD